MDERWIKLFTRLLEWEWHTDPKVLSFWVHALLLAKPADTRNSGIVIPRGSFKTKLSELSIVTGLSVQEVRTCLNKLQKTGEISVVTTNGNHYITILNYGSYQSVLNKEQQTDNKPITNQQQTNNNPTTSEQQTDNNPTTNPFIILEYKNKEIKNKEQQETTKEQSLFFETWEKCKEYLQAVGAEPVTDSGYKRFFLINQIGTGQTKPYGYQDGVKESFELFMSRPANRQRYKEGEKGQRNPPSSAAPLWQRSPVEFFNTHIGNISKRLDSREASLLNRMRCNGCVNGKLQIKVSQDDLQMIRSSKNILDFWNQEFRQMNFDFLT